MSLFQCENCGCVENTALALQGTKGVESSIWVGMMNHLKLFLIGLCVLAGIFLLMSCANQPSICPEIKVSFCPVK